MKIVQINPVNNDMYLLANAIRILNEYKRLGFNNRGAFLEVVRLKDPEYNDYNLLRKLEFFWAGRLKDKHVNDDLEVILEKLKIE